MTVTARQASALVEDHAETRALMSAMLGAEWSVEAVSTADEALSRAEQTRYDVVLLDVNLGGGRSGIDVLRALRELPFYDRVPVLAVTAQALAGDRERLLTAGFDVYVSKPFTKRELTEALRSAASGRPEAWNGPAT